MNNKNIKKIIFKVSEIKEASVSLSYDDEELEVKTKYLPKNVNVGDSIVLIMAKEQDYEQENERQAKQILNEILGSNPQ